MKGTAPWVSERLNDRRFKASENAYARSGADTVFHYLVTGETLMVTYQGGQIHTGHLVGRVTGPDTIELLFHCVTTGGEMLAGWFRGIVAVNQTGHTTLTFHWGWLSGASGGGQSSYVELA